MNFGIHPNDLANAWTFQQVYLVIENRVEQNDRINLGFRVDNLLGNEWQNFHSTGLFDNAFRLDHVGFDLVQLYGEIHLPVLTRGGLDVKGGRFFALSGYENGPAPMRPLLSSSYVDYYANPFTLFGVLTTLHLTDQITLYNGAVNGWDRWIDAHDKWNYTGGFTWFSGDGRTEWTITVDSGPSQYPRFLPPTLVPFPTGTVPTPALVGRQNPDYPRDIRTLMTSVVGHEWTNNFTTIVETDLGYEDNIPAWARRDRAKRFMVRRGRLVPLRPGRETHGCLPGGILQRRPSGADPRLRHVLRDDAGSDLPSQELALGPSRGTIRLGRTDTPVQRGTLRQPVHLRLRHDHLILTRLGRRESPLPSSS